jgi:hypothetical protein
MSPKRRADDRRQGVKYMLLIYDNPDTRDMFCDSVERATEIAARWPNARFCAMEVRPILAVPGSEASEAAR